MKFCESSQAVSVSKFSVGKVSFRHKVSSNLIMKSCDHCPDPTPINGKIINARLIEDQYLLSSIIYGFTCDPGHILHQTGDYELAFYCHDSGTWEYPPPTCPGNEI